MSGTLILSPDARLQPISTELREQFRKACDSWLAKSPSRDTRSNYRRDLEQFLAFLGIAAGELEQLARVRPEDVANWRDHLIARELTNASIRRKMTALRSLYSYLGNYGFIGANPAHSDFVDAPSVPRDGKTVALSPEACRRLLNAPEVTLKNEKTILPLGIRDRALFSVLAFTACRVGELTRLKVRSLKMNGTHHVLEIHGKGGRERQVPLHPEAVERLHAWLDVAGIRDESSGPLFRPASAARGHGIKGFLPKPITRRAVQKLVASYVERLKLDPNISVHSFRVTALTTARERGSDIIDLQEYAGHSDPRTTLTYIRSRDRLTQSPAYLLHY